MANTSYDHRVMTKEFFDCFGLLETPQSPNFSLVVLLSFFVVPRFILCGCITSLSLIHFKKDTTRNFSRVNHTVFPLIKNVLACDSFVNFLTR